MTPITTILLIFVIVGIFAFLLSKLIDALLRIAKRIESTNAHLDDIHIEFVELAQVLSTSLIELNKKTSSTQAQVEELEGEVREEYDDGDRDKLFNQAAGLITQGGKATASLIQRRLSMGYARAARILDQLEDGGYIGPATGSKPRAILKPFTDTPEA